MKLNRRDMLRSSIATMASMSALSLFDQVKSAATLQSNDSKRINFGPGAITFCGMSDVWASQISPYAPPPWIRFKSCRIVQTTIPSNSTGHQLRENQLTRVGDIQLTLRGVDCVLSEQEIRRLIKHSLYVLCVEDKSVASKYNPNYLEVNAYAASNTLMCGIRDMSWVDCGYKLSLHCIHGRHMLMSPQLGYESPQAALFCARCF